MRASDNNRSGGPTQAPYAQQPRAAPGPNSAAASFLKISATLSCSLTTKWSANFQGMGEDSEEGQRILLCVGFRLGEVLCWAGTLRAGCFHSSVPAPLSLHPGLGGLPTLQPA